MPLSVKSHLKEIMLRREQDPTTPRLHKRPGRVRYSISELAEETGIPRVILDRVALGAGNVPAGVLVQLVGHFGLSGIDEIYEVVAEDDSGR